MKNPRWIAMALIGVLGIIAGCDTEGEEDDELAPPEALVPGLNPDPMCAGQPMGTECNDDGLECTLDVCDGYGRCNIPRTLAKCDDGKECTVGVCDEAGKCQPGEPEPDETACEDGDGSECTFGECTAGQCVPQSEPLNAPCGPLRRRCIADVCDGQGTCGVPKAEGTDCSDNTTGPCEDYTCDGAGMCEAHDKQPGAVCVPQGGVELCMAYSCNPTNDGPECLGTCDLGRECATPEPGTCRHPEGQICGCYGPNGQACAGPLDEPVCMVVDECTGRDSCEEGSTCLIDAPADSEGPYAFMCVECADGECPAEDFTHLLLVDAIEDYPSSEDCLLAAETGAVSLLETLRAELVVQAREWCESEDVQVLALSDESFDWQCGGLEGGSPSSLYGNAAAVAICL